MKRLLALLSVFIYLAPITLQAQDAKPETLKWSQLIPAGYDPETLLKKYENDIKRLDELSDDSPEGMEIINRITAEINNAPMNQTIDGKLVKIPGFIAPLDIKNGVIIRFLLVPYFGACIHVPPPPLNQTLLIETAKGNGIRLDEAEYPFEITGRIKVHTAQTDIGGAGYLIKDAKTAIYKDTLWLEEE